MSITRRSFLGYCAASATFLGLSNSDLFKLHTALANPSSPSVIWLMGAGCSGCSISFLNRISAGSTDTLPASPAALLTSATDSINLVYHPTLMSAAGEMASQAALDAAAKGNYILVVEGAVPIEFGGARCWAWSRNGQDVTFQKVVTDMAANATHIVAVGTCASFGGVSASGANAGKVVSVGTAINKPTINISGCPPHPDWIVWAIAQLLVGNVPSCDSNGRPVGTWPNGIYGNEVHAKCPRNSLNTPGAINASTFGIDNQCLMKLGCNGPKTMAPCPSMKWNNGANWCVDANANCLGCVEPTFPNATGNPDFYAVPNSA